MSTKPIRVLMVCPRLPSADSPGSMAPALRQFQSLSALGLDVDIVDMQGIAKVKYLKLLPEVRRRAADADLIHAHFGNCGWLARLQLRKPLVLSFMGSDVYGDTQEDGRPNLSSAILARLNRAVLARLVDAIIVKSAAMARLIAPRESTVIPNGVDTRLFQPLDQQQCRGDLGWANGKQYVLFPGNPANPRKGYSFAREVMGGLDDSFRERVELKTLWGVDPMRVPVMMNACDAMLMVSHAEGSPNVVKEAMACNLPIIGVPVGDVQEVLHEVEGCSVCPRQVPEVVRPLEQALRNGIRSQGRQAIFDAGLDLESVAQRIVHVYETVLNREPCQ